MIKAELRAKHTDTKSTKTLVGMRLRRMIDGESVPEYAMLVWQLLPELLLASTHEIDMSMIIIHTLPYL